MYVLDRSDEVMATEGLRNSKSREELEAQKLDEETLSKISLLIVLNVTYRMSIRRNILSAMRQWQ